MYILTFFDSIENERDNLNQQSEGSHWVLGFRDPVANSPYD
jgi:hypothetical protein